MTLFDDLRYIFTRTGELEKNWSPFMINRFLSFSFENEIKQVAINADKYVFALSKHWIELIYSASITPRFKAPFIKYVKKPSKIKGNYEPIIELIQVYYNWTDKETIKNKDTIKTIIENNDLSKLLRYYNADEKIYRKYKVKITKPKISKPKPPGLERYF